MVSESVVKAMMEISALSFVLPVAFVILWRMWRRKSIVPSLTGVLVFITFGIILKSVPNMFFWLLTALYHVLLMEIYGFWQYLQDLWLVFLRKLDALLHLKYSLISMITGNVL